MLNFWGPVVTCKGYVYAWMCVDIGLCNLFHSWCSHFGIPSKCIPDHTCAAAKPTSFYLSLCNNCVNTVLSKTHNHGRLSRLIGSFIFLRYHNYHYSKENTHKHSSWHDSECNSKSHLTTTCMLLTICLNPVTATWSQSYYFISLPVNRNESLHASSSVKLYLDTAVVWAKC